MMDQGVLIDGGKSLLTLSKTELRERVKAILLGGTFHCVHRDPFWRVVDEWDADNVVAYEGIDYALETIIRGGTAISTWYMGLNGSGTPDGNETYDTPVITELTTEYTEANRPAWTYGTVSGTHDIDNSGSPASFSINTTVTVYGARIVGGGSAPSTKGDTAGGGTLLCIAQFATSKSLGNGDTLEVTYTFGGDDDGV